jgi:hypothetical protein
MDGFVVLANVEIDGELGLLVQTIVSSSVIWRTCATSGPAVLVARWPPLTLWLLRFGGLGNVGSQAAG